MWIRFMYLGKSKRKFIFKKIDDYEDKIQKEITDKQQDHKNK